MLNTFGQTFKDNGYQLMNDRDSPIWQNPSYWPVTFRITPNWHLESTNKVAVDQPNGSQAEQNVTENGFDLSGLDILSGGTLFKNISLLLVPSSDNTGAFHFESVLGQDGQHRPQPLVQLQDGQVRTGQRHLREAHSQPVE